MARMRVARLLLTCAGLACGAGREVAITIDDLPRGGDARSAEDRSFEAIRAMTVQLLTPFREQKIPVTGFVNESKLSPGEMRKILDIWLDAGADLGNHTFSHANINQVSLAEYEDAVVKGETVTRAALEARGKKLGFFRHPYLFTGPTPEIKKELAAFLAARGYRIAPVTFDTDDYEFAAAYTNRSEPGLAEPVNRAERVKQAYLPYMESVVEAFERRSVKVVGREFPQILLIHANQLNADTMPQLLAMFRRRGYSFVTLDHALQDEAYQLPDEYVGRGGWSWIHRWANSNGVGLPSRQEAEPDPPDWIMKAAKIGN